MPTRLHLISFVGLIVISWMLVLWIQGIAPINVEFLKPFFIVVGVVGVAATIFNKWAWAWAIFRGWYVNRPDIRGTWKVDLQSDWKNPDTGEGIPSISAYMAVRQTLTSLSFRLMTPESKSRLIAYSINLEEDGIYRVVIVYRNEPKLELQGNKSEIHHGSMVLEVYGVPPTSMDGNYWTDRNTRGTLKLTGRKKKIFDTFEEAHSAF